MALFPITTLPVDDVGPTIKFTFPVPEYKFKAVAPVVLPIVIVFALALVPILIAPVVPESSVTVPVVPVVKDRFPEVPVSKVIPPVPELMLTAVAPVLFPKVRVLALALVPI
ncbi:TPA: hypothetical protein DCS00_03295, partial [Candidatus Collierbacteria bacterium]|nr:hypothetical protein [Candidatus Collierbacteria bacterium]